MTTLFRIITKFVSSLFHETSSLQNSNGNPTLTLTRCGKARKSPAIFCGLILILKKVKVRKLIIMICLPQYITQGKHGPPQKQAEDPPGQRACGRICMWYRNGVEWSCGLLVNLSMLALLAVAGTWIQRLCPNPSR